MTIDFNELSVPTLMGIVEDLELEIDPFECEDDDDLTNKVIEALGGKAEGEEEEEAGDLPTAEEINAMKSKELRELIEDHELDLEVDDKVKVKKLRKLVIEAIEAMGGEEEEEEEEEEAAYTLDQINEMKKKQLLALIEEEELEIDDEDWDNVKELRQLVIEELDLDEEDD